MVISASGAELIDEIFRTQRVQDSKGNSFPLKANISREEGLFLQNIISADPTIVRTLEIGCAQGISALYILEALSDRENSFHTLIDPNQSGKWMNIGIDNLSRAGYKNFRLLEMGSEYALPKLLEEGAGRFDLIFIDGLHIFDQVMLDLYYANRLVKTGGYIVIDDCSWYTVSKALAYFVQYPAYKLVGQTADTSRRKKIGRFLVSLLPWKVWNYILPLKLSNLANRARFSSMVALKKITSDERGGFWSAEF